MNEKVNKAIAVSVSLAVALGAFLHLEGVSIVPTDFLMFGESSPAQAQIENEEAGEVEDDVTPISEIILSSAQKCEREVRNGIVTLNPRRIQVAFEEVQSFNSAASARNFMNSRGYVNPTGHASVDINQAEGSRDISIATISISSLLPDKGDRSVLVVMRVTQPIACVDGSIAMNSKTFLTTTLKNESGVRSALYQSGEVVTD